MYWTIWFKNNKKWVVKHSTLFVANSYATSTFGKAHNKKVAQTMDTGVYYG